VLYLLSIRKLRTVLEQFVMFWDKEPSKTVKDRINIKRKKKMVIEEQNGKTRSVRKTIIYIEIVE